MCSRKELALQMFTVDLGRKLVTLTQMKLEKSNQFISSTE